MTGQRIWGRYSFGKTRTRETGWKDAERDDDKASPRLRLKSIYLFINFGCTICTCLKTKGSQPITPFSIPFLSVYLSLPISLFLSLHSLSLSPFTFLYHSLICLALYLSMQKQTIDVYVHQHFYFIINLPKHFFILKSFEIRCWLRKVFSNTEIIIFVRFEHD